MPNGVITGNGSKESPFVVMDGYDLNALRNISAESVSDVKHIELGADISLAMYAIFIPIPKKFFNIDGKGHAITDLSVSLPSGSYCGLFAQLAPTEYVKDLVIEGDVAGTNTYLGMFCADMTAVDGVTVENIACYGSIGANMSSTLIHAGVIGRLNVNGGTVIVNRCSFRGTVRVPTASGGTAAYFGGVVNTYNTGNTQLTVSRCMSIIDFIIGNIGTGVYYTYFGGITGYCYNASGCITNITACVGRVRVSFTNQAAVTKDLYFSAILGRTESTGSGRVSKCAAFVEISYSPPASITNLYVYGVAGSYSNTVFQIDSSYAVVRFNNPQGLADPSSSTLGGLASAASLATNSFFDLTEIQKNWTKAIPDAANGVTTAQLKDKAVLQGKGWVF